MERQRFRRRKIRKMDNLGEIFEEFDIQWKEAKNNKLKKSNNIKVKKEIIQKKKKSCKKRRKI